MVKTRASDQDTSEQASPSTKRGATRFGWSLLIEIPNVATSFVVFATLLFLLPPKQYGEIGAILAVASILGPISSFGAMWRLLQRVVTSDQPKIDLGTSLIVTFVGTMTGSLLAAAMAPVVLGSGIDQVTVLLLLAAQVPGFWLVEMAITFTIARGELALGAGLRCIGSLVRVVGVLVFALGPEHSVRSWAWHAAVSSVFAVLIVHTALSRKTGGPPRFQLPSWREFSGGLPYSLGSTTESFLAASDRPLLQRAGFGVATGTYAAAYRITTLAFIPLMALLKSHDREMFAAGANGVAPAFSVGRRVARIATALMLVVSVGLFLAASVVEWFLSVVRPEYLETARVLRWLALLPLIKGVQFSFGNVLTASKHQTLRLRMTVIATAVNFVGNMIFIPIGSWKAAVCTTLLAEAMLAALLWFGSWNLVRSTLETQDLRMDQP